MFQPFQHSIKVPQLYKCASKIASSYAAGEGSIKNLVYEARHPNLKALYSLVVTTFHRSNEIDYLLKKSGLLEKENGLNEWLARVLITELLWGAKRLPGESKPIKTILEYKDILTEHLNEPHEMPANDESIPFVQVEKPRYVRINTLKVLTEDVITSLQNEGWKFYRKAPDTYEEFLERIINLQQDEFIFDYHIPDVLVFAKKTQFYDSDAYIKGEIILQDKSSCLPVHLLDPKPDSCVLDMCAAPGIKTTHMAALMENKGIIYAVDISKPRFDTMNKLIIKIGATCIRTIWSDVTRMTDRDCPNVEYILVDPSCSGSGITNRECINEKNDENRLAKLAGFQATVLRHALTNFPKAKRVVYSTCSLHSEENEAVVRDVIETSKDFKLVDLKALMQGKWINYGLPAFGDIGQRCLRTIPATDYTNGFFIAMFERLQPNETNEFFIEKHTPINATKQTDVECQNGDDEKDKKKKSLQNKKDSQSVTKKTMAKRKTVVGVKARKANSQSPMVKKKILGPTNNHKTNTNSTEKTKTIKKKSVVRVKGKAEKGAKFKANRQNSVNKNKNLEFINNLATNTNNIEKTETNSKSEGNAKQINRKRKKSTGREDDGKRKKIVDNTITINNNGGVKLIKKRKMNKTIVQKSKTKANEENKRTKQKQMGEPDNKISSHWLWYKDEDLEPIVKCKKKGVKDGENTLNSKSTKTKKTKRKIKGNLTIQLITNLKPSTTGTIYN